MLSDIEKEKSIGKCAESIDWRVGISQSDRQSDIVLDSID